MLGLPLPSLDTLLSLPLLSLLVLPSALSSFSWTTSLNLLFFYLAWSSIVLSHDPLNIELFGTLATRIIFYVLPSALFLLFDLAVPSAAVSIKQHGKRALPLKATRSGNAPTKLLQYLGVCLGNVLLGVALQSTIDYVLIHVLNVRSALKISTSLRKSDLGKCCCACPSATRSIVSKILIIYHSDATRFSQRYNSSIPRQRSSKLLHSPQFTAFEA